MRTINPYAEAYKIMYELELEVNDKDNLAEVRMLIKRNNNYDNKNRYNKATCNEVAVVFVANDGEPPIERDICIYTRSMVR